LYFEYRLYINRNKTVEHSTAVKNTEWCPLLREVGETVKTLETRAMGSCSANAAAEGI
jgi:hypothetical protein